MSPNARNKAKELIDRSRTQLKEIAKVTQTIESERYVDMQGHKGNFRNCIKYLQYEQNLYNTKAIQLTS